MLLSSKKKKGTNYRYMLKHGWISKHYAEQKNLGTKQYLTIWFCLHEVQEEPKLVYRNEKNGCLSMGVLTGKGHSRSENVLYIDLDDSYMSLCTCQNPSNCTLKICTVYSM